MFGAVNMRVDLQDVNAAVYGYEVKLYLFAALVSLPTLGFLYFLITRFATGPRKRMTGGLKDIAHGDGDSRAWRRSPRAGRAVQGLSARQKPAR